ncbi:elongation factor P maturation arginine rhamnosyltransferase EarP [Rhodoferax sp.]|uniref:elongation factor P maturation arginine rhamnosyltransferase EarP n=1 Tax=Rhodoferax sp. TaxID=50421 RepID=UPI0025D58599|nr:elongation factor P maturation arginine rhamnosyltransferase EarP [Rhodoferax sp.]
MTGKLWDIFCRVIDNYGDIGVGWRLSAGLGARGERVRFWVDDPSALVWMAPEGAPNVEIRHWTAPIETQGLAPGDILLETFGCEIGPEFIAACEGWTGARGQKGLWINLEYLSAEGYAERNHGLPSPVMTGPGAGLCKYFFYPGFTAGTGGLLREPDLAERQARFNRVGWLQHKGIAWQGERLVSLFCYEPPALADLLDQLATGPQATRLLVTAGRASAAVSACILDKNRLQPSWNKRQQLSISYLPPLTQYDYDHLLWACELNFVRGEDSLVRALWANQPFVWQIYPQHDDAHHRKLEAFLDMLGAPPSLRAFHRVWNGVNSRTGSKASQATQLPALALDSWQQVVASVGHQLRQQDDLVTQIMRFALKNL